MQKYTQECKRKRRKKVLEACKIGSRLPNREQKREKNEKDKHAKARDISNEVRIIHRKDMKLCGKDGTKRDIFHNMEGGEQNMHEKIQCRG